MSLGPNQFSLRRLFLWMCLIAVALGAASWLLRAIQDARWAARDMAAQGPLNQITLALHMYHDEYGSFPPAYIADEKGKPMHSWRVLILPYIEEQTLYSSYDFNEPWNGPNNIKLSAQIPKMYHAYGDSRGTTHTSYVVIVGPQTAFPGAGTTKLADFRDGAENTILLAEIKKSDIVWLEPRDLELATMSLEINHPREPSISSSRPRGPYVTFADSIRGYHPNRSLDPQDLRAMCTIAGGEKTTRDKLVKDGSLR